jgi:hypothetical protein
MRWRYSRQFNVPIQFVETEEVLDENGDEDGKVWATGLPVWRVGAGLARAIGHSQRSR